MDSEVVRAFQTAERKGQNLIHLACYWGRRDIVDFLIQNTNDVNNFASMHTALSVTGGLDVLKFLIEEKKIDFSKGVIHKVESISY